jgi:NADH-quinone oxidoreductase subunit J
MTFSDLMFWVFAAIAVLPAVALVFVRGIVRMAFLLLGSLAGFACLYLHLEAGFLGFTQVVVYIGGILILFLFGVMLTSRVDINVRDQVSRSILIPGVLAGLLVMGTLIFLAVANPWQERNPAAPTPAGGAPAVARDFGPGDSDTAAIGVKVLSTYVLPFEAVSILLLVAMVGATYIGRAKSEGGN